MVRMLGLLAPLAALGCGQLLGVGEFHAAGGAGGAGGAASASSGLSSATSTGSSASGGMGGMSGSSGTGLAPCKGAVFPYQATAGFLMTSDYTTIQGVAALPMPPGRVFGGDYQGKFDFNPQGGKGPSETPDHPAGFLYERIDSPPSEWSALIDATGIGHFVHVTAVDGDATSVAAAGQFSGMTLLGQNIATTGTAKDGFMARFANGMLQGTAGIHGDGVHDTSAVAVRIDNGSPLVLGQSDSSTVYDTGSNTALAIGQAQPFGFVIRYAIQSGVQWTLVIDGPMGSQIQPTGLALSPGLSTNAIAVGVATAKAPPNMVYLRNGFTSAQDMTGQLTALFVAVFDPRTTPPIPAYVKLFGGPFTGAAVDFDSQGAPVVVATLHFGAVTIGGKTYQIDNSALFVAKLADNGDPIWAKLIQHTGDLQLHAARAAVQSNGGTWIAGGFSGDLDFGGGAIKPAINSHDSGFAALLDANGCMAFAMSVLPQDSGGDLAITAVADSAMTNSVYLAGDTTGGLLGLMGTGQNGLSVTLMPPAQ